MLIRHYSLVGDGIRIVGRLDSPDYLLGRTISHGELPKTKCMQSLATSFFESSYFQRFVVKASISNNGDEGRTVEIGSTRAIEGDAATVLHSLESNSVDGAVTSPPYYNAREYSQWSNIYCYLFDMYNINKEVFRVLKPGSFYIFNIFDYFDNENNIALSAMGEKRMILGPYIGDLFRRSGFTCVGNIIWDKGEIEGKRGFNNGNFSPYYQSPFNCWEHTLIFWKHGPQFPSNDEFPPILRQKPVMKMVRGRNIHGHTAPFPEAIPELLVRKLNRGASILDPFAGSMTTALVAQKYGVSSIMIEKNPAYFELGLKRLRQTEQQLQLL